MSPARTLFILSCLLSATLAGGCLQGGDEGEQASTAPTGRTGSPTDGGAGKNQTAAGENGTGSGTRQVYLRVYVDNSARRDAELRLRLNDAQPITVQVPYTGGQPNVKTAFEGNVSIGQVTLAVEEASGASRTFRFDLNERNWVVVSLKEDGSLDAWQTDEEPKFD